VSFLAPPPFFLPDLCAPTELQSESMGFKTPVGGSGGPKDVGSVALSLLVNRFVNGETILVDGGTLLVHPSSY
jgi:NAD(P)-dependent dehydrogenase (short-subunit alcohol dehydrogenase family)